MYEDVDRYLSREAISNIFYERLFATRYAASSFPIHLNLLRIKFWLSVTLGW